MGKNPAFQFYPSDWTRDLDDQDLEIEGAWIRICCRLWWSDEKGKATKNLREWSNILRTHPNKTVVILKTLLGKGIATGEYLDNQNITIISRRMVRDYEISKIRQEVGKLGGNPGLMKIKENLVNQKLSKSASLQSSSSSSSPYKESNIVSVNTDTSLFQKNGNCPHQKIIDLYHEILPELPALKLWTEDLQKILRTRWKEDRQRQNLEWWRDYFLFIKECPFLVGKTKENFVADLQWVIGPKNMTKIINGRYVERQGDRKFDGIREWLKEQADYAE